jgi:hypothetical protein
MNGPDYAVIELGHDTPYWIWTRGTHNGYGATCRGELAHRTFYEAAKGANTRRYGGRPSVPPYVVRESEPPGICHLLRGFAARSCRSQRGKIEGAARQLRFFESHARGQGPRVQKHDLQPRTRQDSGEPLNPPQAR